MPAPLQRHNCRWVANVEDLQAMIRDLQSADMLAVDVEHHHKHSYLGFVCLLQLYAGKFLHVTDIVTGGKLVMPIKP